MLGPCLALGSGSIMSGSIAGLLALAILGYDAGLKHTWLGPEMMGTCRGLNFLLGMTHAAALGGPVAWLAAIAYAIYVAGITIASRSEAVGGARASLVAGLVFQIVAIIALVAVSFSGQRFPVPAADRPILPLEGLLILAMVAFAVSVAASRTIEHPVPERIQRYIKTGILSLVWLHVGLIAAVRGPALALPIAASLASCLYPGPLALFDLMGCDQAWSGRGRRYGR